MKIFGGLLKKSVKQAKTEDGGWRRKRKKKMSVRVFVCEGKKKVFYSASQISIFNQIQKNKVYENGNVIIEQVK